LTAFFSIVNPWSLFTITLSGRSPRTVAGGSFHQLHRSRLVMPLSARSDRHDALCTVVNTFVAALWGIDVQAALWVLAAPAS
jgi:hypothetical protein